MRKVLGAMHAQLVHPMQASSSTNTNLSRSVTGSPSSSTSMSCDEGMFSPRDENCSRSLDISSLKIVPMSFSADFDFLSLGLFLFFTAPSAATLLAMKACSLVRPIASIRASSSALLDSFRLASCTASTALSSSATHSSISPESLQNSSSTEVSSPFDSSVASSSALVCRALSKSTTQASTSSASLQISLRTLTSSSSTTS
mmetsp:Transcript_46018/g.103945  ORF Transcript_46018/g.103945 Transcript_46018/m.103945 type:complete len:201 (+) Transcript_46018:887-1489(+)